MLITSSVFIYALNDPISGRCRYVGKSKSPRVRFKEHCTKAFNSHTYKNCWLQSLLREDQKPVLEILDSVPENEWQFWEQEYIRVFNAIGFKLTNGTGGGEGGRGLVVTEEMRNRMRMAQSHRKPLSADSRHKMRLAKLGKPISESTRLKRLGRRLPKETCRKMSVSRMGHVCSKETREKISAANSGRSFTDSHKKKLSEAQLRRFAACR